MPPTAIEQAIAEISDLDELEILDDLTQYEGDSKWTLKFRIAQASINPDSDIPEETDWYVRIDQTYPGGNIHIHPAKENGIEKTYPHQRLNTSGSDDTPWRTGNICVDRYEHALSRHGGFQEPFDGTERLRWHLHRAILWVELASNGELRDDGDPYELPEFGASQSDITFGYNETRATFDTWSEVDQRYGVAYLSKPQDAGALVVTDYKDLNGGSVHTPLWGDTIETDTTIPGVWLLLDEPPIKHPWTVPENWDELTDLLPGTEDDTFTILGKTRQAFPDETFRFVIIGFPIPERIGEDEKYIHWQAIKIDDIPNTADFNGFRDLETYQIRLTRMSFKNEPISWVESDNWAQDQLLRRGRLDDTICESNIMLLGAGALGSTVAENLLRDGCTAITIVDGELFEIGNLSRHTLGLESINRPKATALAERLQELSPHATINDVPSSYPISEDQEESVPEPDIILDCTGNDRVLFALGNDHWEDPKLVVSTSLGPRGDRLYVYATYTHTFDETDFDDRYRPWSLYDLTEHRPNNDIIPERVGCWHPTSIITMNKIAQWGGMIPELLEQRTDLGRGQSSFTVLESIPNDGSISVESRNAPFSNAIRWTSSDDRSLELPRTCLDEMIEYFRRDSPDETGGILTGIYPDGANGRVVRGADPPPDSIQSPTTFVRGTEAVEESLKESKERFGLYYIGEWHTHPGERPTLSPQDAREMQSIADDESYECPHPFLIIIGGTPDSGIMITSYLFNRNGTYEELTLAGQPPSSDIEVDTPSGAVVYHPGGGSHD